jgi:hypothetical protein
MPSEVLPDKHTFGDPPPLNRREGWTNGHSPHAMSPTVEEAQGRAGANHGRSARRRRTSKYDPTKSKGAQQRLKEFRDEMHQRHISKGELFAKMDNNRNNRIR